MPVLRMTSWLWRNGGYGRWVRLGLMASSCLVTMLEVARAQDRGTGAVAGVVRLDPGDGPARGARVFLLGSRRMATTASDGTFVLSDLPPGTYELVAQRDELSAERQVVTVLPGVTNRVVMRLSATVPHEEVTVTATAAGAVPVFDALNSVTTVDGDRLAVRRGVSITDALAGEPGISVRSFGVSNTRPMIRGFDGDRVLIMEDGIRTGDLSGTSADHAVSLDPSAIDRLEVVRGPATLLFGNNAIGGVVNAITAEEMFRASAFSGTVGNVSFDAASSSRLGGIAASVAHGVGRWFVWGGVSTRRSGDYSVPGGRLDNTSTERHTSRAGVGWTGQRLKANVGVQFERNRFGIPSLEDEAAVTNRGRKNLVRGEIGLHGLLSGPFDTARLKIADIDYEQTETETVDGNVVLGTAFQNRTFVSRLELEQRQSARVSGRLGFDGLRRGFVALGDEALAPRTTQSSAALFAYEEIGIGRHRLEFGGRLERTAYHPRERPEPPDGSENGTVVADPPEVRVRDFLGFSGSAGVHLNLGMFGSLVTTITQASRAPALEELYNFGPDAGNGTFEIGNPNLDVERTLGFEVSLRRRAGPASVQVNAFTYAIADFVFLDVDRESQGLLRRASYIQGDARFLGAEIAADLSLTDRIHLAGGGSGVRASLVRTGESLPRIPPVSAHLQLEINWDNLKLRPRVDIASRQGRVFREESSTQGWAAFSVEASYGVVRPHASHVFALRATNLANRTYRLHTAFLKDVAPEPGRGVNATYTVKFF
jgi:iron complex outermembrane receptor protein